MDPGRVTVVFVATIPCTPAASAVSTQARRSLSERSGESLTKTGAVPAASSTPARMRFVGSAFCSSRRPGVFGEDRLTVKKSASPASPTVSAR